ncbi:MAG: TetR/AcrR family transcriptional regulator [Roseibium sp.]|nr:TetR/AcrR family transcriptional regulator [Roseibium sp.]
MKRADPYNRDTALDAAMTLFWRKGYHATSLKDLEAALDMKPGSIYAAFKSKQALFLATLERYFLDNRQSLRTMVAEQGSPLAALAEFMRKFGCPGEAGRSNQACMVVKTMLDTTEADRVIGDAARDYLDQMGDEFTSVFRAAERAGELPPGADPDYLAHRYQMNLTALRIEVQRGRNQAHLARLAEDLARELEALRPA